MRRLLRLGVLLLFGLGLSAQTQDSCLQCKWLPCLRNMRDQKQRMVRIYEGFKAFWDPHCRYDGPVALAVLDFGPLKPDQRDDFYRVALAQLGQLQTMVNLRAQNVPKPDGCALPDDFELSIATDGLITCKTDQGQLKRAMEAMPCAELANLLARHEALHAQRCAERWKDGKAWEYVVEANGKRASRWLPPHMLTAYGQCIEEIEAYQVELKELNYLIDVLEERCQPRRDHSGSTLPPSGDSPSTSRSVPPRQAPPMPRAKPIPPPKPLAPPKPIS